MLHNNCIGRFTPLSRSNFPSSTEVVPKRSTPASVAALLISTRPCPYAFVLTTPRTFTSLAYDFTSFILLRNVFKLTSATVGYLDDRLFKKSIQHPPNHICFASIYTVLRSASIVRRNSS